jgi:5-methylthioadenosine/S-adenosylhomocysteine deaminase
MTTHHLGPVSVGPASADPVLDVRPSRRSVLVGAAGGVLAGAGLGIATPAAAATRTSEVAAGRPIVIRKATVISMDREIGVLADADVLVIGEKIAAVGRDLPAPGAAAVIEAHGAPLLPGFVDTHRHLWQSSMRSVSVDWTLAEYFTYLRGKWAPMYRPEDIYASTYFGMVDAINDGVTTVMDWSHNNATLQHAEAGVEALLASKGRARFGYGNQFDPTTRWVVSGAVDQLINRHFSSPGGLVSLQLATDVTDMGDDMRAALRFARDRGLPVSSHVGVFNAYKDDQIQFLSDGGYLSPSYTLVHADTLSDDSYRRIADSGASLSLSVESEASSGQGYPPTAKARQLGVRISLSVDTVARLSGDMFTGMRSTLISDRLDEHRLSHQQGKVLTRNSLRALDVLEWATIGGARALGLDASIGSITVGKKADLVLLRHDSLAMTPFANPVGHVVSQAGRGEVDTVLINGRIVKRRGVLTGGVDSARARRLVTESLTYLRGKIGEAEWLLATDPPRP